MTEPKDGNTGSSFLDPLAIAMTGIKEMESREK
jgi:hypothetical protein